MDKTIPTKVIRTEGKLSIGYATYFTYCPNCKKTIGSAYKPKKCYRCEQKIL